MAQRVRTRPQKTIRYQSNSKISESLSRGMIYREIYLRLQGKPTITAANNTTGKTQWGDEWGCIKRIDLIANNTDVIKSLSGNALWWLNYFMYNTSPAITPTLGDGSTANPSFDSTLILPLWMPGTIKPIQTALDARNLSDLKVEITWGSYTDVNSSATGWTTEPTLDIHSLESFGIQGPFSTWRVHTIEKEITADNEQFQVILPVGDLFRGFILNFTDGGSDSGAILKNLKWKSGTTVFADQPEQVLQAAPAIRQGRSYHSTNGSSGSRLNLRRGSANSIDGWYFYDHVTDGYATESEDTLGLSEHELELNVVKGSGTTKVTIYPQIITPVRGA